MRLTERDRSRLSELNEMVAALRLDAPPILETVVDEIRPLLRVDCIGSYSFRVLDESLEPEQVELAGAPCGRVEGRERLAEFLERNPRMPGAYDAARPHPKQRNTVLLLPPTIDWLYELEQRPRRWEDELGLDAAAVSRHLQSNLETFLRPTGFDQHQMRVLLCDGETILGYLGTAQAEPFTERQRLLLAHLVQPLRERVKLEQQLKDGPLAEAALDAALEAIPAPAFVITASGTIRAMNDAGAWLRGEERRLSELLRDSARGEPTRPGFRMTPIEAAGFPRYFLAVKEAEGGVDRGRVAAVASRWALTNRQGEVLARVVRGDTNKAIASELGLGQSTVELHITKILEKAEVTSRSELIAKFWTQC